MTAAWKARRARPGIWYLHIALKYDPHTGHFWWRHRPDMPKCWNNRYVGTRAGRLAGTTYPNIKIGNSRLQASWVAIALSTGHYPKHEVDYIDGDGMNLRLCNLREATHGQNVTKRGKTNRGNLPVGVTPKGDRFHARLRVAGKEMYLGLFDTAAAAGEAYAAAALEHSGVFASRASARTS